MKEHKAILKFDYGVKRTVNKVYTLFPSINEG